MSTANIHIWSSWSFSIKSLYRSIKWESILAYTHIEAATDYTSIFVSSSPDNWIEREWQQRKLSVRVFRLFFSNASMRWWMRVSCDDDRRGREHIVWSLTHCQVWRRQAIIICGFFVLPLSITLCFLLPNLFDLFFTQNSMKKSAFHWIDIRHQPNWMKTYDSLGGRQD